MEGPVLLLACSAVGLLGCCVGLLLLAGLLGWLCWAAGCRV